MSLIDFSRFFFSISLFYYSKSDSNSRLSEEVQRADAATEEAVDDVDLEVQRLLSVYDLVKDEESLSRLAQVLLYMKLIFIII